MLFGSNVIDHYAQVAAILDFFSGCKRFLDFWYVAEVVRTMQSSNLICFLIKSPNIGLFG